MQAFLRRNPVDETHSLHESPHRAADLAELRQDVRRQSDRPVPDHKIPGPGHLDPVLDQRTGPRPIALRRVEQARGLMSEADRVRIMDARGEPQHLGFVFGCLRESAERGKTLDQQVSIDDRWRCAAAESLVGPLVGQRRDVIGGQRDHALVLAQTAPVAWRRC